MQIKAYKRYCKYTCAIYFLVFEKYMNMQVKYLSTQYFLINPRLEITISIFFYYSCRVFGT